MEEAVEWAKRCPNPMPGEEGVIELRPTNTLEDFAALLTDEHRASFERASREMQRRKRATSPPAKARLKSKAKPAARRKKKAAQPQPKARRKPARAKAKK